MVEQFWSEFLQNLLMALAPVLAAAAAAWLVASAKKLWEQAKAEQPEVTDKIEWAANIAVKAAEQAGAAKLIDDKKAYAIEFAQAWLLKQGLKVDVALLAGAIEAKVFEQFKNELPIGFAE